MANTFKPYKKLTKIQYFSRLVCTVARNVQSDISVESIFEDPLHSFDCF